MVKVTLNYANRTHKTVTMSTDDAIALALAASAEGALIYRKPARINGLVVTTLFVDWS